MKWLMNRTHTLWLVLGGLLMLPWLTCGQWVAYNDHVPGTIGSQTHLNATLYNARYAPTNTGPLKNIQTGATLPVTMTYTVSGGVGWITSAATPNPGTPLYNTFDGYVFFGTKTDSAILIVPGETVSITFTGLDPQKTYTFQGGAIRGLYGDRWTLATLEGADSYTSAHSSGALTTTNVSGIPRERGGHQHRYESGRGHVGVARHQPWCRWHHLDCLQPIHRHGPERRFQRRSICICHLRDTPSGVRPT